MTDKRIDWKNKIVPKIKEILEDRRSKGIPKATIRGIFYILISLSLVPNLKGVYKGLSRALVTARERNIIPDGWIADESRQIIDIDDTYYNPKELIQYILDDLDKLPDDYQDKIPKWHKQPIYVEIWVEKQAMARVFKSILDPEKETREEMRLVRIVPNSGWASRTYWINNANRLIRKYMTRPDNVVVLYFGDYDPSGCKMAKKLKKMLEEHGIAFRNTAVTKEQIKRFHLEHLKNTDPVVLAKLKKDNNRFEFMKENNGELFQIELDALQALRPDDLRDLLLKVVDDLFDKRIYKRVLDEPRHQPEEIRRLVLKELTAYIRKKPKQKQKQSSIT